MSRLHPDGAPGAREMYLRQQLGDTAYLVRTVVALLGLLVGCALGAVVVLAVWAL